jgi:hypothetical protein
MEDFENMSFNEILSDFGPETINHKKIQRKVAMSDVFIDHYKSVLERCNVSRKWEAKHLPDPPTFPEYDTKIIAKEQEIKTMQKIIHTLEEWEQHFQCPDLPFPSRYVSSKRYVSEYVSLFTRRFVN